MVSKSRSLQLGRIYLLKKLSWDSVVVVPGWIWDIIHFHLMIKVFYDYLWKTIGSLNNFLSSFVQALGSPSDCLGRSTESVCSFSVWPVHSPKGLYCGYKTRYSSPRHTMVRIFIYLDTILIKAKPQELLRLHILAWVYPVRALGFLVSI